MKTPITQKEALAKCAALCARCEHAAADLRLKMAQWGLPKSDIDTVIDQLIDNNYLNDSRFAHAFVRDKFRFSGWGKIKIAHHLRQKGISSSIIAEALQEISDDDYRATLTHIIEQKSRGKDLSDPAQKASVLRFAASRGFEPHLILDIL